jgi:NADPH2:quinone reductase
LPVAALQHDVFVRAIVMSEFGPPEVLTPTDVDEPISGPDQVLIEVQYVNVTFVETQVRAGRAPRAAMLPDLPVIPGNGVGGLADRRQVISSTGGSGAYAERVAVDVERLIAVPDGVSLRDATALLSDGRTAVGLIARAELKPGETALIEAAAGGVGSLLVQLARAAGAKVIAAAGSAPKLELARELGADFGVDYSDPAWATSVAAQWGGVDVVFDGVGGAIGRGAFELLRSGGRHCAFGMASGGFAPVDEQEARERGVTLVRGAVLDPTQLNELTKAALTRAAAGELRAVVGQMFPLERAADAHRAIETRASTGKTLLTTRAGAG